MESNRYKLLSDQELAGLFRTEKDAAAFEELFFRHKNSLYTFARRFFFEMPVDGIRAMVHEAFIRSYVRLSSRGGAEPFRSMLYGIIIPLGLKQQKARKDSASRPEEGKQIPPGGPSGKGERNPQSEEIRTLVFRELGRMDDRLRGILLIKFIDGMNNDDISRTVRMSVPAVRSELGKAFSRISPKLRKDGYIDPVRKCGRMNTAVLFDYAFEILDKRHKKDIQAHTRRCPACRKELKKILTVRFVLKNTPQFEYEDDTRLLLNEAGERSRSMSWTERLLSLSGSLMEKFAFLKRFKIRFEYFLATGFLFLILSGLMVLLHNSNNLYITLAEGDVMVNGRQFFQSPRSRYSLKTPLSVLTGKGRCILQVNGEKLIMLLDNSDIILKQEKEGSVLALREGLILCHVRNLKGSDRFVIRSSGAELRIPGAVLYAKSSEGLVEAGVREGKISAFLNSRLLDITANELLLIQKNRMRAVRFPEKKRRILSGISGFSFLSEPSRSRLLLIKGEPEGSRVYREYRLLGQSPVYLLASVSEKEKFVVLEHSYQPQVFSYTGQDVLSFKLKTLLQPRMIAKYRMPAVLSALPLAVDRCLILPGLNGSVYKMNRETRKINWAFRTGKSISTVPLYENNTVYFASRDGFFYAVDFITGERIWRKRVGPLVSERPVIHGGRIYFGTSAGVLYELDLRTGNILWSRKFAGRFSSSPCIRENLLFIGNEDHLLYAVHLEDKEIIWTFGFKGRMNNAPPLCENAFLYFSTSDRTVYAVEALTGRLKWTYRADSGGLSSPVFLNGLLLAVSARGRIHALDAKEGFPLWNSILEHEAASEPAALAPSFILVGDRKRRVHLFNAWGLRETVFPYPASYYLVEGNEVLLFDRKDFLYVFSLSRD